MIDERTKSGASLAEETVKTYPGPYLSRLQARLYLELRVDKQRRGILLEPTPEADKQRGIRMGR